ncbi:hypothetical protein [Streptomyces luteolus]|uniref:Gram-positive cocci surface proteins LPxTG domain-containing protein n=1 Tax=Streptomyces luteolus TaxID=3043615 RepID=A0ABT6T088_9ACTN|nr:hypothetical protein [Streptomyces sp. B-S-A12]MDI3421264.1 hypothetical protein [Streptomyces sp. B-S-A12]
MKLRRTAPCVAVAAATGALLWAAPAAAASATPIASATSAASAASAASGPLAPAPASPSKVAVVAARSGPAEPLPEPDSGTQWIIGAGALTLAVGTGMVALGRHRPGRKG